MTGWSHLNQSFTKIKELRYKLLILIKTIGLYFCENVLNINLHFEISKMHSQLRALCEHLITFLPLLTENERNKTKNNITIKESSSVIAYISSISEICCIVREKIGLISWQIYMIWMLKMFFSFNLTVNFLYFF